MKDFSTSAAGKLIKKAADAQAANSFFTPEMGMEYTLLDETKRITVAGKQQERLQVLKGTSTQLLPPTALSGFFMNVDSATNFAVIPTQSIGEAMDAIAAGDGKFTFEEGEDCLVYSRKYDEDKPEARTGEVLITTSSKQFWAKPGKTWKIVSA